MLGFKLRISGVSSNRSTNCATTTAQKSIKFIFKFFFLATESQILNHHNKPFSDYYDTHKFSGAV